MNADIEQVLGDDSKNEKKLADHAFVFMARAVFKPSLVIPVAHYFSSSLSGKVLVDLTKQLLLSICIFIIIGEKIFPMASRAKVNADFRALNPIARMNGDLRINTLYARYACVGVTPRRSAC